MIDLYYLEKIIFGIVLFVLFNLLYQSPQYFLGTKPHVPVLFWNKTFNDKWGMELLLPARGFMRYNEIWIALRAGRVYPLPCALSDDSFPRRFWGAVIA